jgi:hypothetical protein
MKTIDVVIAVAIAIFLAGASAYAGQDTAQTQAVSQGD